MLTTIKHQSGVSLIETLISLTILALGLLGVIAVLNSSLRGGQQAEFSLSALRLGNDMVNRIYAYNNVDITTDNADFDKIDTEKEVSKQDCKKATCDAEQQVKLAHYEWKEAIQTQLPNGRGMVEYDGVRSIYIVKVMWDNDLTGAQGTACSGNNKVDLNCFIVEAAL